MADVEILLSKKITVKYSSNPASDWLGFTKGQMNIHLIEDDGVIMSGMMFNEPYVRDTAKVIQSIWKSQLELPVSEEFSVSKIEEKPREKITTESL